MVIGRSGTGKSTVLNLVAGLIKPTAGNVFVEGRDLQTLSDKDMSQLRSSDMGYVFQFPSLLPSLTVLDNIAVPASFAAKKSRDGAHKRAKELLGMLGLGDRLAGLLSAALLGRRAETRCYRQFSYE